MADIEERPTKSGKPNFRVKIRIAGHPPASASFKWKADAVRWAKETEAAILQGKYFKTAESRKHSFGELIDRYISSVLPTKPNGTKIKPCFKKFKGPTDKKLSLEYSCQVRIFDEVEGKQERGVMTL